MGYYPTSYLQLIGRKDDMETPTLNDTITRLAIFQTDSSSKNQLQSYAVDELDPVSATKTATSFPRSSSIEDLPTSPPPNLLPFRRRIGIWTKAGTKTKNMTRIVPF